jgi:hypothetical protein
MIFFLKGATLEAFIQDSALTYLLLSRATKMGRDAMPVFDRVLAAPRYR